MVTLAGGERGVDRLLRELFWKSLQIFIRELDYHYLVLENKTRIEDLKILQYKTSIST